MTTDVAPAVTERRYSVTENYLLGSMGLMRYWASEPRQGVPLLFVHGYGGLIEHWRSIMRLVAREHTFYAIDLYGFGYSARPRNAPTKEGWAEQIITFIREVIGAPTVVVGHSLGGVVAVEFARSYPDLTRGLVLVNSTGMQAYERPWSISDRFVFDLLGVPMVGETLAGVVGNEWGVRQTLLGSYHRKERVTEDLVRTFSDPLRRHGAASYLATTRNAMRLSMDAQPGEYTGPALLIWGIEDRSVPASDADAIKRRVLPQADITLLPDSGHCPFDETPEEFCASLLPWIGRLG